MSNNESLLFGEHVINERGGSLFVQPESEGGLLAINPIGDGKYLVTEFLPRNYPSFTIFVSDKDDKYWIDFIQKEKEGWYIRKNNIGVPEIDNCVEGVK